MAKRYSRHFPWIVWVLIISVLSFLPGDKIPEVKFELFSIDSVVHFGMYFVFSVLLLFGFTNNPNFLDWRLYIILTIAGFVIGWLTEVIQGAYIYRRYFDYDDLIANSIGTIVGTIGYGLIGRKLI